MEEKRFQSLKGNLPRAGPSLLKFRTLNINPIMDQEHSESIQKSGALTLNCNIF